MTRDIGSSIAAQKAFTGGDIAPHIHQPRNLLELLPRCYHFVKRRTAFLLGRLWASAPFRSWDDNRYADRRSKHAANLPGLAAEHAGILTELGDAGVAIRTLELPCEVLDSAYRFLQVLRSRQTDEPCVKTTSRELASDPTLFMWGLSDDLLDLAECHIGLPPRYLGVEVKREIANPAAGHSHEAVRRWHLDHEDRRILKVIVYLSDVDDDSAPFEYVGLSTSESVLSRRPHIYHPARFDDVVRAHVPVHQRRKVVGPRMTAIYVDTGRVLHRVRTAQQSERYSVTFAYCGRRPHLTYSQLMLPGAMLRKLRQELSSRQWEALCCRDLRLTQAGRTPREVADA